MANLKRCCRCKEWKELSEFFKDRTKPDGFDYRCKKCLIDKSKKYRQTEDGKATYTKYNNSKLGKLTSRRYMDTHKDLLREKSAQARRDFPERMLAMRAVNNAIIGKRMPKASELMCAHRGKNCKIVAKDYHHYKGYEPENWLNVVPVCRRCHRELDKKK